MGAANSREAGVSLTKAEADRLKRRFERQAGKAGKLSQAEFLRMPEFSGNFFLARIFTYADSDKDGYITLEDFKRVIDTLGRLYSEEDKLQLAFTLYDLDHDGFISHQDLHGVLQHTVRNQNNQQLNLTVASLLQEYDADKDGRLSFQEFQRLASAGPRNELLSM